jgi:branched-chain amino acid transport system permease protein
MPTPVQLIEHTLNGLVAGTLYVTTALGLSIIFGLLGVVNFSHGILFALGAYMALVFTGFGFGASLILAPIAVAVVAMLIEVIFLRRFYRHDPRLGLLFTFGLALVGEETIRYIWGPTGIPFGIPTAFRGSIEIFGFVYSTYRIFVLGVIAFVIVALWWFLHKTPIGMIIRAGSRDPEMVRMLGVGLKPTFTLVFGIGAALAGLAGVLAAPLAGVQPAMGADILTAAFVVVVIGGLGSFWGPVAGGLLVGVVVGLTRVYWPPMSEASMFVLMVVVLLLRPRGLFGEEWEAFE